MRDSEVPVKFTWYKDTHSVRLVIETKNKYPDIIYIYDDIYKVDGKDYHIEIPKYIWTFINENNLAEYKCFSKNYTEFIWIDFDILDGREIPAKIKEVHLTDW